MIAMARLRSFWPVLTCLCCLVCAPGRAQDAWKFTTFNIRYGTARDGENRWEKRCEAVIETIRGEDPDVLGVQEALAFQLRFLAGKLPQYAVVGEGREGGERGEHSALLVRRTAFEVRRSGTFWLSETPEVVGSKGWDAALPRISTWALLRARRGGAELVVFNTHFDHRGPLARENGARVVVRRVAAFSGLPRVVMGDLNAGEESAPLKVLREGGLRSSFRAVHPGAKEVGTFNGFSERAGTAKIDHLLCDDLLEVRAAAIVRRSFAGRWPSDHFPVSAELALREEAPHALMPVVAGDFALLAANPDLGELGTERHEVVDHALFPSSDGNWQLWACIRGTTVGRVLYRWRGESLESVPWRAVGIAMRAETRYGESLDDWGGKEWIQAPFVIRRGDEHWMYYGGHRSESGVCQICLATSRDGVEFERRLDASGRSRIFVGPGEARDPMVVKVGEEYLCYYTGHDPQKRAPCKVYARRSSDGLSWSEPLEVCWGGSGGLGAWDAECPFVVRREGFFYLFRTSDYRMPLTHVYRSEDPLDFGRGDDSKKIGTIAVAAPEVVVSGEREFISSVHDLKGGVRLAELRWIPECQAPHALAFQRRFESLWNFETGDLQGWKSSGEAFRSQPTFADTPYVRGKQVQHEGRYYIGSYEDRPDPASPAGGAQGDAPQGELRSPPFTLPHGSISFLLGGGRDPEKLFVALVLVEGERELWRCTGHRSNRMRRVVKDVQEFAGQKAYLRIVDASSDAWGHIDFDDLALQRM